MASRILAARMAATAARPTTIARRTFASSSRLSEAQATATPLPARKPVGAFRGGLFGFLLGAVGAGSAMYTYVVQEYKVSNELLTEDIYNLQTTVQRIESYVRVLEDKVEQATKKK